MRQYVSSDYKIGILGGGQLGRMLIQSAMSFDLHIAILDPNPNAPSAAYCNSFTCGSFKDYDTVVAFGKNLDLITVEIEDVNTEALRTLISQGKQVHPHPDTLDLIRDKGHQKQFYKEHQLATAPFILINSKEEAIEAIQNGTISYPFVQKVRTGGYDGKGVAVIGSEVELHEKWLDGPSIIEEKAAIKKELAVIVAGSDYNNQSLCYPPVEMLFDETANLVAFLASPAQIPTEVEEKARTLAKDLYNQLGMRGLLAVELFWNNDGSLWINEVAPRPHNSGHHSIEGNITSQFEQHLRSILNWPLGDTSITSPSVMINVLGSPNARGKVVYNGMEEIINFPGVYPHLYGKKDVSPYRKMGHITCVSNKLEEAISIGKKVKEILSADGE